MIICLGGFLLAGRAFQQMHNGRGGSDWLLLPASPLEKYSAAFATYVIAWPTAAAIASVCLSAMLEGIALLLKSPTGIVYNPLAGLDWGDIACFVIFLSSALAASARYAKLPLVKAGALVTAWGIVLALLFMCGIVLFTPEGRAAFAMRHAHGDFQFSPVVTEESLLTWLGRISMVVTAVLAVVYGYFRVSEKEAVDEVQGFISHLRADRG